jgi:hypothetical protein
MSSEALLFVAGFVVIILAFIFFVATISKFFGEKIPKGIYSFVELIIILGILLSIVGLFQPWLKIIYTYSFTALLASTIAFMIWSHITPKPIQRSDFQKTASKQE